MTNQDTIIASIAAEFLGIETLATRNSDRLDFHEVAVWRIKAALEAAFAAGGAAPVRAREVSEPTGS